MGFMVCDVALSAEQFLAVYRGQANRVLLFSVDGRKISLPARHLRPFLQHAGIYGRFSIEFSEQGELVSIRQMS